MREPSKEFLINQFKVIIDTREKTPYRFKNSISQKLDLGDYTIQYNNRSYESDIVIERKSAVSEIYSATGKERNRWEKELEGLAKLGTKFILCEFNFMDIVHQQPQGLLESSSVYGSIASWQVRFGIPFIFCESRTNARAYMFKIFQEFVKHKILNDLERSS